jgi:hypothetical protein
LLGWIPNTPLSDEGQRVEPPPSLPMLRGVSPAAVHVPGPPLEPPEERAKSQGHKLCSATKLSVVQCRPNSGVLVFPTMIAPAFFARSAWMKSSVGMKSL